MAMTPRLYQAEILNRAQQANVIAALDTGAGKTFIALLLIKWISATRSKAKSIFLVPKAALVEQQAQFIVTNSTLRVDTLYGFPDIPFSDSETWASKLDIHDVVVMTPQILVNLLTHGLWTIDQMSLLVFDECHHAQKNHPYNVIMREYFQLPQTSRPKILGITASPVWNVMSRDVADSLSALEHSMDAKIFSVQKHTHELERHAPKAAEIIKLYPSQMELADAGSTLESFLDVFASALDRLNIDWAAIRRRHSLTRRNLGLHCSSLCMYLEVVHKLQTTNMDEQATELQDGLAEIDGILAAYEHLSSPHPISLDMCSPKLQTLVEILLAHITPTFQGIVFVEHRQTAACLARVLPLFPQLADSIRCGELFGQRDGSGSFSWLSEQGLTTHATIQAFREHRMNLVIATSVAEEGLDFPSCSLVVRFDFPQNMPAYLQSRGRARMDASTFAVMIEEGNTSELARYQAFVQQDPELKALYQEERDTEDELAQNQDCHPSDLPHRQRFVIESTGAILTYDNAGAILNRLCSRISRDGMHKPKFSGEFQVTLTLPPGLGLSREDLCYTGPSKNTKREAKRAVIFTAVKRLFELGIFNEHLLPAQSDGDVEAEIGVDVAKIPNILRVLVKDPWTTTHSEQLWIHPISVSGKRVAGLVTGTRLPPVELKGVKTFESRALNTDMSPFKARELMHRYTKECIHHRISGSPIDHPLTFYVVPLIDSDAFQPDWASVDRVIGPWKQDIEATWQDINETHYGRLMVRNMNIIGHVYLLQRIRYDLSPVSTPLPDTDAAGFTTYHQYWTQKWTGKNTSRKPGLVLPENGPLLELIPFPRLNASNPSTKPVLFPLNCCRWIDIPEGVREVLHVLPALYRQITSVYRARRARECLSLPPISDDVLLEALTLPSANAGYSNQRLETLGDAVLQLCTSVNLFNKYPYDDEGQLSKKRQNSVSNRFLLSRAKQNGLEAFMISETPGMKPWLSDIQRTPVDLDRCVPRDLPRRSLQETVESTLGASFVCGGIEMALRTGQALGMNMGGAWSVRGAFASSDSPQAVPEMFSDLQDRLGYSFRSGALLLEALTHPSFDNQATNSYQRLEFLGDAVIYLVVMDYMYRMFSEAKPDQLAWPRTRAVAAPAQAMVGVKQLNLHRLVLINDLALSREIEACVPQLLSCSGEEIVNRGWRYDPPKALSDVFESVIGAVFVDSNYNWDKTAAITEGCMVEVLSALNTTVPRDPITEVMEWLGKAGCRSHKQLEFRKCEGGVSVWLHGVHLCGPVSGKSTGVSKQLAAVEALGLLKNRLHEFCDC
ncbi:hypothetical protein C8F01DRAFT_82074 [Mycena amicta]|nr:hypothetical protein C8F01DRAFT_82074 [Mycena amicta]